jgi:hypothetical protein
MLAQRTMAVVAAFFTVITLEATVTAMINAMRGRKQMID